MVHDAPALGRPVKRALQAVLIAFGLVAGTFGAVSVVFGGDAVPGPAEFPPSLDSELRYYAAWYVAGGGLALRAAARPEDHHAVIRLLGGALLLGAAGRLISLLVVGKPHWIFLALMVVEVVAAVCILVLNARRTAPGRTGRPTGA